MALVKLTRGHWVRASSIEHVIVSEKTSSITVALSNGGEVIVPVQGGSEVFEVANELAEKIDKLWPA